MQKAQIVNEKLDKLDFSKTKFLFINYHSWASWLTRIISALWDTRGRRIA